MATITGVQILPQGLLIPQAAIQEWLGQEIEVIKDKERIIIQPRGTQLAERERVLRILEAARLLLPPSPVPASYKPLSPEEQAELARKFSKGRPLSEIVIEERAERA